jgi:hypothetical protein
MIEEWKPISDFEGFYAVSNFGRVKSLSRLIHDKNGKPKINHIDGNKLNNTVQNLEWCSREENMKHAWRNGFFCYRSQNGFFARRPKQHEAKPETTRNSTGIADAARALFQGQRLQRRRTSNRSVQRDFGGSALALRDMVGEVAGPLGIAALPC